MLSIMWLCGGGIRYKRRVAVVVSVGLMEVMTTMITVFEGWAFIISTLLLALGFYYIGRMHGRAK